MTLPNNRSRKVPGRRAVIGTLGVTQILAWGSSYYLPAVLATPIHAETGWSLSHIVAGLSLGLIASGLASPLVGRTIDRHGGRLVLAASSALLAAGLALVGMAQSLPAYLAAWLVVGLGMSCGLYDAAFGTLGRLYGGGARGAITSLTLWGGFASTVCWPLSAILVEHVGWRWTCFAYAAIHLALTLPAHLLVLRAASPARHADEAVRPRAEAGTPGGTFLVLAAILVLVSFTSSVVAVHLLTMLQARGLDLAAAVALGALVGPAQVGSRVIERLVGHRYQPIWTMLAANTLTVLGLAMLLLGIPIIALALLIYGAGNGIFTVARGTVPLALFGAEKYAAVIGRLARPALLAGAIAPWPGAIILERGGAGLLFAVLLGASLTALALAALLRTMSFRRGKS